MTVPKLSELKEQLLIIPQGSEIDGFSQVVLAWPPSSGGSQRGLLKASSLTCLVPELAKLVSPQS